MLILLEKNLLSEIESLCGNGATNRLRCLTNLLQSHADGRHIAVIHPSICRILEDCNRLSEEQRAIAKKIRIKYPELAVLSNILRTYARLCATGTEPELNSNVWEIPFDWLAANNLNEVNLVCEDLYDCDICKEAAADFLNSNGLNSLRLKLDPTPGGGGNTHRVLERKAITEQRISICVVDSDKTSPGDVIKPASTAGKCMTVSGPGIFELLISDGREIENHIPSRLLDKVHANWEGNIPSNSCIILNQRHPGITLFCDLKSGIRKWDIDSMSGTNRIFWEAAQQALGIAQACCTTECNKKNSGDCATTILQPIGRSLLRLAGEHLRATSNNPKRHTEYLPSPNDSFWKAMGSAVASYCIAPKSSALI